MWKKEDAPATDAERTRPDPAPTRSDPPRPTGSAGSAGQRATIGRSITIRGEVTGDEDLLIQGSVDGSVKLDKHSVTVGPEGDVKADITARVVTVEGSVEGDLEAEEQVILRASARVQGDIKAPRVVLEDGASFRGGVDMGESATSRGSAGARSADSRKSAPEPPRATTDQGARERNTPRATADAAREATT